MSLIDISIIVPVYNASAVIEKCLLAIRNQEGIDRATYEIIVVDDASTDSSAQKAGSLCDRLITLPKNFGAAKARNTGVRAAAGEIIVFVDSDVILEPHTLSHLISVFKKDEWITAAVGRYSARPADNTFLNAYHNAFTQYHHDLCREEIDWFWGALSAVRKEAFLNAGGFDERFQGASGEDLALGRVLFDKGYHIVCVPDAQGAHGRQFTFSGMIKNDYQKAVTGMKMKLSGNMPKRAPGFINPGSMMTSLILILCPLLFLFNFVTPLPCRIETFLLIFTALIIINIPFYVCIMKMMERRVRYLILIVPLLHWLQMYAILTGALMGAAGHVLGRSAFGRPGWI